MWGFDFMASRTSEKNRIRNIFERDLLCFPWKCFATEISHQPIAAEVLHNPNQAFANTWLVSFQPIASILIDLEGLY